MRKSDFSSTLLPPLWDRLRGDRASGLGADSAERELSLSALAESVEGGLRALFLTRCPISSEIREAQQRGHTVLEYGLPDLTVLRPLSMSDHQALRVRLEEAVVDFEPRLLHPHVVLRSYEPQTGTLHIEVEGQLAGMNGDTVPVSYLLSLNLEPRLGGRRASGN